MASRSTVSPSHEVYGSAPMKTNSHSASTVPEMLSNIVAVGSDLRFLPFGGGMGGTTVLVEGMTLAGD